MNSITITHRYYMITIRYYMIAGKNTHTYLVQRGVFLCQAALLDDGGVEEKLSVGPFHDFLLHGAFRDEAEHLHRLRLPDAVGAVHGLKVHLPAASANMCHRRKNHRHHDEQTMMVSIVIVIHHHDHQPHHHDIKVKHSSHRDNATPTVHSKSSSYQVYRGNRLKNRFVVFSSMAQF